VLLAAHIGSKLGKNQKNTVTKNKLQAKLGKDMKITSTRLGEMTKAEIVTKTDDDEYEITTFGLLQMQKDILPRIKAKTHA
jgi:Mn-dependent DtxR family transcriptional regulator